MQSISAFFWYNKSISKNFVLIIGGSGSGKTNSLFNLISHQQDIAKDSYEWKYQLLISKRESAELKIYYSDLKISLCL